METGNKFLRTGRGRKKLYTLKKSIIDCVMNDKMMIVHNVSGEEIGSIVRAVYSANKKLRKLGATATLIPMAMDNEPSQSIENCVSYVIGKEKSSPLTIKISYKKTCRNWIPVVEYSLCLDNFECSEKTDPYW